jgi:phosphoenolpyruvate synthase/pyruvate phosphate dikinase
VLAVPGETSLASENSNKVCQGVWVCPLFRTIVCRPRSFDVVAHLFEERDGAVERMVKIAIEAAHRAGKKIGICGAPSDYPEFAEFLVQNGFHSSR